MSGDRAKASEGDVCLAFPSSNQTRLLSIPNSAGQVVTATGSICLKDINKVWGD